MLYSIKLYIGITTSMYLAMSICELFILLIKVVNGAQLLNTTFIPLLPPPADTSATVIVPLTSIYASP